jgi:hypothetical protein
MTTTDTDMKFHIDWHPRFQIFVALLLFLKKECLFYRPINSLSKIVNILKLELPVVSRISAHIFICSLIITVKAFVQYVK